MIALLLHSGSLGDVVAALQFGWASIDIRQARTRAEFIRHLQTCRPDITVLDTRVTQLGLVREMREVSDAVIVAVSARYEESELIAAVEAGCDDYMQTPVQPATFVARVRAALRRVVGPSGEPNLATCGSLEVDSACHEARVRGRPLHLTPAEFELLRYFAEHNGHVARHKLLSRLIWADDSDLYSPWLRKHIQHLRRKLAEAPRSDIEIITVPRVGYKLVTHGHGKPK